MTVTCNFISTLTINSACHKPTEKHVNGDHMTTGCCDDCKYKI